MPLSIDGKALTVRYAIGKGGLIAAADKREGDHCTPVGAYPLRECWYRADRLPPPQTELPLRVITPQDGWCDDPSHLDYNRHVTLPFAASHEKLWRGDPVYDLIIPLGYNDAPPTPGKGSAIFLHVARENYEGTEGCVALKREDLLEVLKSATRNSSIVIQEN